VKELGEVWGVGGVCDVEWGIEVEGAFVLAWTVSHATVG